MEKNLSKEIAKIYEKFEEHRTKAKENSDIARDYKNEIMELIQESGRESVVFQGLEAEDLIAQIEIKEREVINKKKVCDLLGIKTTELRGIPDWISLVSQGKLTPEIISSATEIEEREHLSFKKYREEEEE